MYVCTPYGVCTVHTYIHACTYTLQANVPQSVHPVSVAFLVPYNWPWHIGISPARPEVSSSRPQSGAVWRVWPSSPMAPNPLRSTDYGSIECRSREPCSRTGVGVEQLPARWG